MAMPLMWLQDIVANSPRRRNGAGISISLPRATQMRRSHRICRFKHSRSVFYLRINHSGVRIRASIWRRMGEQRAGGGG